MTIFEGKTIEKAIASGLLQLGVDQNSVRVDVISEGKRGFLGFGAQPARVELTLKEAVTAAAKASGDDTEAFIDNVVAVGSGDTTAAPAEPKTTAKKADRPVRDNDAGIAAVQNYLETTIAALGINVKVQSRKERGGVVFDMEADKDALLIGKHGKTINALQFLAQTLFNHRGRSKWTITLNVGDYRERRQRALLNLAQRSVREVVASGKPVYLDPMPSFERKILHKELADNEFVTTRSEGTDPRRFVVVVPKRR